MKPTARTIAAILGFMSTNAAAGQIDLMMTGFASDEGQARIILMQDIEEYTSVRPVSQVASVPFTNGEARWSAEVAPGTYAIIAHHDRNANDDLDRPVFELPLEPYGYSNGAWTSAGLPDFEAVAFEVGDGVSPQRIPMRVNVFVTVAQVLAASAVLLAALFTVVSLRRRRTARTV